MCCGCVFLFAGIAKTLPDPNPATVKPLLRGFWKFATPLMKFFILHFDAFFYLIMSSGDFHSSIPIFHFLIGQRMVRETSRVFICVTRDRRFSLHQKQRSGFQDIKFRLFWTKSGTSIFAASSIEALLYFWTHYGLAIFILFLTQTRLLRMPRGLMLLVWSSKVKRNCRTCRILIPVISAVLSQWVPVVDVHRPPFARPSSLRPLRFAQATSWIR